MSYNEDDEIGNGFRMSADDDEPIDMPEGDIEIPEHEFPEEEDDDPESRFH